MLQQMPSLPAFPGERTLGFEFPQPKPDIRLMSQKKPLAAQEVFRHSEAPRVISVELLAKTCPNPNSSAPTLVMGG